jgi:hypothetical protein
MIDHIRWGQNPSAGITSHFAEIELDHVRAPLCNGVEIGSQITRRSGQKIVTGANQIRAIQIRALDPGTSTPVHTRALRLSYEGQTCTASHAPVRLLTSIEESASGIDSPSVTLPAVTFEYGSPTVSLSTSMAQGNPMAVLDPRPHNLGWGRRRVGGDDRWPTVEAMLLDIDGDGLQDRVWNASTPGSNGSCRAKWERNLGVDPVTGLLEHFAQPLEIELPRLKWNGNNTSSPVNGSPTAHEGSPHYEGCALNGQFTAFTNSEDAAGVCHGPSYSPCEPASDPNDGNLYCNPGGRECPLGGGGGPEDWFLTYLAYRWLADHQVPAAPPRIGER